MTEYKEEWKYITKACLNVTDNCNLACHYCFVQQKPNNMTLELAKQAVDWLWNNFLYKVRMGWVEDIPNEDLLEELLDSLNTVDKFQIQAIASQLPAINFFGGEPMLMYEQVVKPLILYIRQTYGRHFMIGMTTNGTLLTPEIIDFLKRNYVGLLLSIDGDRETQELTRPCRNKSMSSFDMIMKNLPYLLENYPYITFRATVNQENVSKMFENFIFAEKQGFKSWFFSPNEREKWTEENLAILEDQVDKIFYYNLQHFLAGEMPPMESSLITDAFVGAYDILTKLYHNEPIEQEPYDATAKCGVGISSASINYEGNIYACQEQDTRDQNSEYFKMGNIFDGIDETKQKALIDDYNSGYEKLTCEDEKECETCKLKLTCQRNICPSTSMDLFNNVSTKSKVLCFYRNCYANNAITVIKILLNEKNETFYKYINKVLHNDDINVTYRGYK